MKKVYFAAFFMAIVVGVAVWLFATNITKEKPKEEEIQTVSVVTAVNYIKEGTTITQDMLKLVELPETAVLNGAHTKVSELVGRITVENIYAQEQITDNKVRAKDDLVPTHLSYALEEGYRAVTISVNSVTGVGYYIKNGDKVDILFTAVAKNEEEEGAVQQPAEGETEEELDVTTMPLLQNVEVIAVGTYADNSQEGELTSYDTVTFSLPVEDAITLVGFYNSNAKDKVVSLLLRNRDDESTTEFMLELNMVR